MIDAGYLNCSFLDHSNLILFLDSDLIEVGNAATLTLDRSSPAVIVQYITNLRKVAPLRSESLARADHAFRTRIQRHMQLIFGLGFQETTCTCVPQQGPTLPVLRPSTLIGVRNGTGVALP
jgi:hypothetical protein